MSRSSADEVASAAALCGSVSVLQTLELLKPGGWSAKLRHLRVLRPACLGGHISVVQWAINQGCDATSPELLQHAFAGRQPPLPLIQLLLANGAVWSASVSGVVAEKGHLELLQWARTTYGASILDSGTLAAAAAGGHRSILEWLRLPEQGCVWDESVCEAAAESGDLALLQWLRREGAPWDSGTCMYSSTSHVFAFVPLTSLRLSARGLILSSFADLSSCRHAGCHARSHAYSAVVLRERLLR
jgi:hypothetical protein